MTVPVYSTLLIDSPGLSGSAAFLVPPGYICVVRDIDAVWFTGIGGTVEAGRGGAAVFWGVSQDPVLLLATASWRGRHVIPEGDQLVIATSQPADVSASGFLLSLP